MVGRPVPQILEDWRERERLLDAPMEAEEHIELERQVAALADEYHAAVDGQSDEAAELGSAPGMVTADA